MKPIVIIYSKLKVLGITLFPFIVLQNKKLKEDKFLMNHEKIHIRQELEMLVLPFYIWYLAEYFLYRAKGMSKYDAYRNISFEKEAYVNDYNLHYLKNRFLFSFLKYLGK